MCLLFCEKLLNSAGSAFKVKKSLLLKKVFFPLKRMEITFQFRPLHLSVLSNQFQVFSLNFFHSGGANSNPRFLKNNPSNVFIFIGSKNLCIGRFCSTRFDITFRQLILFRGFLGEYCYANSPHRSLRVADLIQAAWREDPSLVFFADLMTRLTSSVTRPGIDHVFARTVARQRLSILI